MKRQLIIFALLLTTVAASAQFARPVYKGTRQMERTARKWVRDGSWRNGFTASPDKTVDRLEFYTQYERNQAQWDAMFKWLSTTDLLAIPKGKHPIPGTTLVASVEDSENQPLEKRRSESHYRHVDFQYVVRGTEGFATLHHLSSPANCAYDAKKDVIHYDYDPARTHFFQSTPGRFVIFFPSDWHIAKIATREADQAIRVIVVKLDYID